MTLHKTTVLVFKISKWLIVLGGVIVTIFMVVNISGVMYKILYPPPPEYPNVLFGKLPLVAFPESTVKETFTYSIETLTGSLPTLPEKIKVYKTVSQPVTLSNINNVRNKVAKVGFINESKNNFREIAISPTRYQWQVVKNDLLRTIVVNTDTYDFKFTTSYRTYPAIFNQSFIGSEDDAKIVAEKFLHLMSLPIKDVDPDKTPVRSLMLKNGVLLPAESTLSTHVFRVDLFQADIDKLPVYYSYHPFSSMYFFVMSKARNEDDVLEANFYHQSISDESATYPIKTAKEAFSELEAGNAYISNYYGTSRSIQITDVTLGYFFGETRQSFSMPVVLFQSKDNFFAFVPAIKNECLTTNTATLEECQGKNEKKSK